MNQLLVETQGKDGVFFMGATNLPHQIDEAFLRRFQRRVYLPLPTLKERVDLIKYYLEPIEHTLLERDIVTLAHHTENFSPNEIEQMVGRAYNKATDFTATGKWFVPLRADEATVHKFAWAVSSPMDPRCTHRKPRMRASIKPPPITMLIMEDALEATTPATKRETVEALETFNAQFGEDFVELPTPEGHPDEVHQVSKRRPVIVTNQCKDDARPDESVGDQFEVYKNWFAQHRLTTYHIPLLVNYIDSKPNRGWISARVKLNEKKKNVNCFY